MAATMNDQWMTNFTIPFQNCVTPCCVDRSQKPAR